jgi:hypothetical protein
MNCSAFIASAALEKIPRELSNEAAMVNRALGVRTLGGGMSWPHLARA